MAEQLTPQQHQAVVDRGGKLLISAAAGSGKTKVLVDRLMSYLEDPIAPANMDEFLIITYTKAAAAELRGKIAAKLSERIAADPGNKHLLQQFQRLYLTQISTVHAFCAVVLKEYAYLSNIPSDFRVADENECAELRLRAMERVLENAYDSAAEDEDFRTFVNSQGIGRDDRLVPELVLKVYDSGRCHLRPDMWLEHCLACTEAKGITDALQTPYGAHLAEKLFTWLDLQIDAIRACVESALLSDGMEKPVANLNVTLSQLEYLRQSVTWDEIVCRRKIDFGTLRFPKNCADPMLVDRIKAVRDACKKALAKQTRYFADDSETVLKDLASSAAAVRALTKLVKDFEKTYSQLKHSRRILDFSDLEHRTLDLLLGAGRSGVTKVAKEIGSRFREVMVDEYQDSNAVQDAIYSALTEEKQNLFMVGDVKQSIYQFRLADPGIFLEKYATYVDAEVARSGDGRKVLLSSNFRSGGAVLAAVNDVFENCMSPQVGGLFYGPDEALNEGVPHAALGFPEVQLHCVDVQEDTYGEEAAYVAQQIKSMLQSGTRIRQGSDFRPVQPEDIVILLRSPGSAGQYFQAALDALGIRCVSGGGEDLLQTQEVSTLHSLLQVIQNPLQDIPLVAVMSSPVFGFTADEMAAIRSRNKITTFYDAVCRYESHKCKSFVEELNRLRKTARTKSLTTLLEEIFVLTHMDTIFGIMDGGEMRKENLHIFYHLAASFEAGGQGDLGRFLDHLQMLEQKGLIAADDRANAGAVTIMSIHKSKGLEFPVVFLCGLSREFNTESQRASILCHKQMGIGMSAVDHSRRVRYPTVAKGAIASAIGADGLSEELRVLYVAMTRAKDVLVMTYASDRLEKELQEMVLRLNMGGKELLTREAVCPGEWVLLTALTRTEAGELFALGGKPNDTSLREPLWGIYVVRPQNIQSDGVVSDEAASAKQAAPEKALLDVVNYQYSHISLTTAASKQTATQLKGRAKDDEASENAKRYYKNETYRRPSFRGAENSGKEHGNAMHAVMQYIDYDACGDIAGVCAELDRLVVRGLLLPVYRAAIRPEQILRFFETPLGRQLRNSDNVIREFKFSILWDGEGEKATCPEDMILLQGVVDCAMVEEDGIILIDFKTDHVSEATIDNVAQNYAPQVSAYALALQKIYQKEIKRKLLYFFSLGKFVEV